MIGQETPNQKVHSLLIAINSRIYNIVISILMNMYILTLGTMTTSFLSRKDYCPTSTCAISIFHCHISTYMKKLIPATKRRGLILCYETKASNAPFRHRIFFAAICVWSTSLLRATSAEEQRSCLWNTSMFTFASNTPHYFLPYEYIHTYLRVVREKERGQQQSAIISNC